MSKSPLPESIMSQSYGLSSNQVQTVEILGALSDRAKQAGSIAATAWIDPDGCPHLEALLMPEATGDEFDD